MTGTEQCTWKDCVEPATKPQIAGDGKVWENLCDAHAAELDAPIDDLNVPKMLRAWILAQGGAQAAAERMTGRKR